MGQDQKRRKALRPRLILLLAACAGGWSGWAASSQTTPLPQQTPAVRQEAADQAFLLRRGMGAALPGQPGVAYKRSLSAASVPWAALAAARSRAAALRAFSAALRPQALNVGPQALSVGPQALSVGPQAPGSRPEALSTGTITWQPLGPVQLSTAAYGLVTGRISSLAVDPNDPTGNTVYLGATGGGVWKSTNAAGNAASVTFRPLTDDLSFFANSFESIPSLSIGAVSVEPGNANVILAGTGDPNDALDSYYGVGILRSTNGGTSWSLISESSDGVISGENYAFEGVGFAGFAWSTATPNLVVAAASQSLEELMVNTQFAATAETGLYYSTDAGQTWHLATVEDGTNKIIQSSDPATSPPGTPATSVVWNARRGLFIAAIRFHGYYSSSDGMTWTRLAQQPGANLSAQNCPADPGSTGSTNCPIFRGVLAVQPVTGDTFALTTDLNNKDQGLYRDVCSASGSTSGGCTSATVTFGTQLNDTALDDPEAAGVIDQADYNLSLAAVASQQDTILLAGTEDIYRCSLANSCAWRDTTNDQTCAAAQVAPSTHAIDGTFGADGLIYFGNDGGLWRTTDTLAQTGAVCAATDASHVQNLNGGIGSLAEISRLAVSPTNPALVLAGMNGFGVVASESAAAQGGTGAWQQLATGEGSYVAIEPTRADDWYATIGEGLSIYTCPDGGNCSSGGFGSTPVVGRTDVEDDADYFLDPAPWMLDPGNAAHFIVGTCRMWMGPVTGDWSSANLISGMLDNDGGAFCNGNAELRSIGAGGSYNSPQGGEQMYAGMAGPLDGGGAVPGHVYGATVPSSGGTVAWADLWRDPVTNTALSSQFNAGGYAISSIAVDPADTTGKTIYVGISGFASGQSGVLYGSTDGGAHWENITNSLPAAPVDAVAVDPANDRYVYVAGDFGVYYTTSIASCSSNTENCWSVLGAGLPNAPVTDLQVVHAGSTNVLEASTYGRGIWTIGLTTTAVTPQAALSPTTYTFSSQVVGARSAATASFQLTNPGSVPVTVSSVSVAPADYAETNNCGSSLSAGGACTIQVTFTPAAAGDRPGTLTVDANTQAGVLTVALDGQGLTPGTLTLSPATLNFPTTATASVSSTESVTVRNTGGAALTLSGDSIAGADTTDFSVAAGGTCPSSLAAGASCSVPVVFDPVQAGTRTATLEVRAAATGSPFTVGLTGSAVLPAFLLPSPASLSFPSTPQGGTSATQTITITNTGGATALLGTASVSGDYILSGNTCGTVLNPSTSCAVTIVFRPENTGSRAGLFTLVSPSVPAGQVTVALGGTGLQPSGLSMAPSPLSFGAQQQATVSSPRTITVTDASGSAAQLGTPRITGSFAIASDSCPATLAVGSTCSITVTFTPAQLTAYAGTLTLPYNNGLTLSDALSGTGATAGFLNLGMQSLIFPVTAEGTTTAPQTVSVVNDGGTAATINSISASGSFVVTENSCPAAPQTLAAGAACSVTLTFTPPGTATYAGTLTLTGAFSNSPLGLPLSDQGALPANGTFSPAGLAFPDTAEGSASSAQTITLTSSGGVALVLGTPSVTSGYQIASDSCPASLATGSTCTLSVLFHPGVVGAVPGTLIQPANVTGGALTAALSGNGLVPGVLMLSPLSLGFSSQVTGSRSAAQAVTVSNTGGAPIALGTVSVTGDFAIAGSNCPLSLAASASCVVSVTFAPTAVGARAGQLTVPTTAGSAVVTLDGTGLAPGAITLTPSSLAYGSTAIGSTATQTLTATNPGGVAVHLSGIAATGDFAVSGGSCSTSSVLAANGGSCTLTIAFTPSANGQRSGVLTLSGDGTPARAVAALTGFGGTPGNLVLSPASLSFGSVIDGEVSPAQTVTANNSGELPVSLGTLGVNAAGFSISANTCGATLAAGASCSFAVAFAPTQPGVLQALLSYPGQYAGSPAGVQLSGTGVLPAAITFVPSQISFAAVATGTTASVSVQVESSGGLAATVGSATVSQGFAVQGSCPASLAPGASCTLTVSFAPQSTGALAGLLTLPASVAGGSVTAAISADGVLPGALAGSVASLTFPSTVVGSVSAVQTDTFENPGGVAVALGAPQVSSADYSIRATTCGSSLAAGASCSVSVAFTPTASGDRPGTLTLSTSGAGGVSASVALDGSGLAPAHLVVAPASLSFGSWADNTTSPAQTLTLSNTGGVGAVLAAPVLTGQYSISANSCPATLASGSSCSVSVLFAPTGSGSLPGSLGLEGTSTLGGASTTATATLSGTGHALVLNPVSVAFTPALPVGTASRQVLIAVQNVGSAGIALDTPTISCGTSLAANATCAYGITFTPTAAGLRTGVFTISDGPETQTTQLSGQGLSNATDTLNPTSLIFGSTSIGLPSTAQSITLTNSGDGTLTGLTVEAAGPFAVSNNCGASLGGHLSCQIAVTFTPVDAGPASGTLTVADSIRTQLVALSGQGAYPPNASASPASLDFGSYAVGATAPAQVVTLSNQGTLPLTSVSAAVTGNDFTISGSTCGSSLPAASICQISIAFEPSTPGTREGVLSVTSSAAGAPLSVNLNGAGEDFALAVSGAGTAVITSGQTATYGLVVTPVGNSSGTLAITCAGAPANATCTANPSTLTVEAGVTGGITLSVQTAVSTSAQLRPRDGQRERGWLAGLAVALLLPVGLLRGAGRRRFLLVLLAGGLLASPLGCGVHASGSGSSGGSTGPGQTPGGTYTLTVTAAYPGATKQVAVQLVVQ
jgi:hypothetical protein